MDFPSFDQTLSGSSTASPSGSGGVSTSGGGGFLSGVNDLFGSVLSSPAVGNLVNNLTAPKPAATVQQKGYDAFGRLPGQVGYGTSTPPAGYSATGGVTFWNSLSMPVKIGGGILVAVLAFVVIRPLLKK